MRALAAIALVAACGGGKQPDPAAPRAEDTPPVAEEPDEPGDPNDPRFVYLTTMTEALDVLAAEVQRITESAAASPARCETLAEGLLDWGGDHLESYEVADAEGAFLGITEADARNRRLHELGARLARTSARLVELVDEECLDDGAYGAILFEYLVAYQGLAHWVKDGDPAVWDYDALIATGG
jgi:hypothetical protein